MVWIYADSIAETTETYQYGIQKLRMRDVRLTDVFGTTHQLIVTGEHTVFTWYRLGVTLVQPELNPNGKVLVRFPVPTVDGVTEAWISRNRLAYPCG